MVAVSLSHETPRKAASGWFGALRRKVIGGATVIGASIRVARAVEARHDPDPKDLAALGVNGPLPKAW